MPMNSLDPNRVRVRVSVGVRVRVRVRVRIRIRRMPMNILGRAQPLYSNAAVSNASS